MLSVNIQIITPSTAYNWVCCTYINITGLIKKKLKMYMTMPNGSILWNRVTQMLTLSGPGSKFLPNVTLFLLLLEPGYNNFFIHLWYPSF